MILSSLDPERAVLPWRISWLIRVRRSSYWSAEATFLMKRKTGKVKQYSLRVNI